MSELAWVSFILDRDYRVACCCKCLNEVQTATKVRGGDVRQSRFILGFEKAIFEGTCTKGLELILIGAYENSEHVATTKAALSEAEHQSKLLGSECLKLPELILP